MNKLTQTCRGVLICFFLAACVPAAPTSSDTPRNVVFLLGDGMGYAQVKAYRMFADDPSTELVDPLAMDGYQVGSVSTDSIRLDCGKNDEGGCVRDPYGFTDSASSATAYATGQDTVVGRLSMNPAGEAIATIFEVARTYGKSTGLVATSELTHASPAAFCSHVEDREQATDIADQYFDNQRNGAPLVDVLLGGGLNDMRRKDRDLLSEFHGAGYEVVLDRAELLESQGSQLLGLFAAEGLPRAWDRGDGIPSLAEMTERALQALDRNSEGFFLLVEGSQVDWASHDNSVVGVVSEMEDFVGAIGVVLDFARQNGDTLVIITADHETGGMSLGREDIYRWDPRPLRGVRHTPKWINQVFLEGEDPLSSVVAGSVPFELTEAEKSALDAAGRSETAARTAITALFDKKTVTGWTTPGHTGVDVPLYVYGPGSEHFYGVMQNEAVGQTLWDVFLPSH